MPYLAQLQLDNNNFSGSIPASFSTCAWLSLSISENMLSRCIGKWAALAARAGQRACISQAVCLSIPVVLCLQSSAVRLHCSRAAGLTLKKPHAQVLLTQLC